MSKPLGKGEGEQSPGLSHAGDRTGPLRRPRPSSLRPPDPPVIVAAVLEVDEHELVGGGSLVPSQQQDVPCAETGLAQGGVRGGTHQLSQSWGAAAGRGRRLRPCPGAGRLWLGRPGRETGCRTRPRRGEAAARRLHSPSWTSLWQKTTGEGVDSSSSLQFRGETPQQRRGPAGPHPPAAGMRGPPPQRQPDRATDTAGSQSARNLPGTLPRGRRDPSESRPPGPARGPRVEGTLRGQGTEETSFQRSRVPPRLPARRLATKQGHPPPGAMPAGRPGSPEALHLFLQVVSLEVVELLHLPFLGEGELRNLLQVPGVEETALRWDGRRRALPPHHITSPPSPAQSRGR